MLYPLYHCVKANGETAILGAELRDKDLNVAMVTAWMQLNAVDRYVFMDEAWMIHTSKDGPPLDLEWINRHGLRNHPDRREAVMFSAENRRGEFLTAKRYILRPETGNPTLAPLQIDEPFEHSKGRMVGLLKARQPGGG